MTSLFEINDDDRAEIARLVAEGNTSGVLDTEDTRLTWNIDIEKRCAWCDGTGEETFDESDGEGHITRGTGTRRCRHLDD